MGLMAGFTRILPLPRALRGFFAGSREDFSIKGVERQSLKNWKLKDSISSVIELGGCSIQDELKVRREVGGWKWVQWQWSEP